MERWARLTWQAGDPERVARLLGERLGAVPVSSRHAVGAWGLWLGTDLLEVVPWRREQAGDNPVGEGRLLFEPVFPGQAPAGDGADVPSEPWTAPASQLVAVIWATVDLERAEADLSPWLEPLDSLAAAALLDEPHLGGRGRVRATSGLPGGRLVLLEPTTEGALAASLARDGEGPCGLYVRAGSALLQSALPGRPRPRRRAGPLGVSVRLRTAVRAGPHLLLLEPGTIAP